MIDSMFSSTSGGVMCFLDKKKQLPGDEFDISVWKPLDTKGKPINQDEPLIYNHYSGKCSIMQNFLAPFLEILTFYFIAVNEYTKKTSG